MHCVYMDGLWTVMHHSEWLDSVLMGCVCIFVCLCTTVKFTSCFFAEGISRRRKLNCCYLHLYLFVLPFMFYSPDNNRWKCLVNQFLKAIEPNQQNKLTLSPSFSPVLCHYGDWGGVGGTLYQPITIWIVGGKPSSVLPPPYSPPLLNHSCTTSHNTMSL